MGAGEGLRGECWGGAERWVLGRGWEVGARGGADQ